MESFPSLLERTVASSLLLLSGLPHSLSTPQSEPDSEESEKSLWLSNSRPCSTFFLDDCSEKSVRMSKSKSSSYLTILDNGSDKCKGLSNPKWRSCLSILDDDSENSIGLSNSKSSSCLSSLTRDDGSSVETCAHRLRMVAVASHSHEMKFKVTRRSRTPIMKTTNHCKILSVNKTTSELSTTTTEASSCLSSGSSGGGVVVSSSLKPKPPVNSASIRGRAEGIMRVLSYGCASEVRIRQMLGDSPDTSKALRMLLKKEKIRRSGIGGRCDPYMYKIA